MTGILISALLKSENNLLMAMKIKIFITNWHRIAMLRQTLELIKRRTETPHEVIVFDNGSDTRPPTPRSEIDELKLMHESGIIDGLILWPRNTGCYFPKAVFYSLTTDNDIYYVSTDNDVYPPLLDGDDWLKRLIDEMDRWPTLGALAPQVPPTWLQEPYGNEGGHVLCKAVGNTLTVIRRSAWPVREWQQKENAYGDDGLRGSLMTANGWQTAYMDNLYCLHAGQCRDWGYRPDEIAQDPRKIMYGKPYEYTYDIKTYEPTLAPPPPQE